MAAVQIRGSGNQWVLESVDLGDTPELKKGLPFPISTAKKFFAGTIFVQSPRSLERQLSGDQIGTANDRSGAALGQIDLRADNGAELRSVLGGKATVNDVRFCADAAR